MIDNNGFRANVGIILSNQNQKLFWGHRIGCLSSWQFPQGGIDNNESPDEAMFRELKEETGLLPEHVKIIGSTDRWLKYRLPQHLIRRNHSNKRTCIGQKQIWFLLEFLADESVFKLDGTNTPEFDHWKWIEYWQPISEVIHFKRKVYDTALTELAPLLFKNDIPQKPAGYQKNYRKNDKFYYHTHKVQSKPNQKIVHCS